MGVHDYVCFVQRNGQCLNQLELLPEGPEGNSDDEGDHSDDEFDGCGSRSAAIVFVPNSFSVREILSWPLSRFRDFTMKKVGYSWDGWSFEEYEGYDGALRADNWWEQSIWQSPSAPGFHLVNFEEGAYQAFVLGEARADQIPRNYLNEVFSNRHSDIPSTKEEALAKILEAGPENLWSYDRGRLEVPILPTEARSLYDEINATPFFSRSHIYSTPLPVEIGSIRYATLISDELQKLDLGYHMTTQPVKGPDCQMNLSFSPPSYTHSTSSCLFCEKRRWPALETCLEHRNREIAPRKAELNRQAREQLDLYMKRLSEMRGFRPPETVTVSFNERGVQYTPVLRLLRSVEDDSPLRMLRRPIY